MAAPRESDKSAGVPPSEPQRPPFFPISPEASVAAYLYASAFLGKPDLMVKAAEQQAEVGTSRPLWRWVNRNTARLTESMSEGFRPYFSLGVLYVGRAVAEHARTSGLQPPAIIKQDIRYKFVTKEEKKEEQEEDAWKEKPLPERVNELETTEKTLLLNAVMLAGKMDAENMKSFLEGVTRSAEFFREADEAVANTPPVTQSFRRFLIDTKPKPLSADVVEDLHRTVDKELGLDGA